MTWLSTLYMGSGGRRAASDGSDAPEASGSCSGRRGVGGGRGRGGGSGRSGGGKRGRRRERKPSPVEEEEDEQGREEEEDERVQGEEEKEKAKEGAVGGMREVWLRGPSQLPQRLIPLARRLMI